MVREKRRIPMRTIDYFIALITAIIMIVGAYQFYFFCQRHPIGSPRELPATWDDHLPFWPSWVWVYSGLYYPVILYLVFVQPSFQAFHYTAFSFLVLLAMQCVVFLLFPVHTPARWRNYDAGESLSHRMLAFVHRFDRVSNSMPSMHVSVATLTGIYLAQALEPSLGRGAIAAYAFPVLIALSAIFTKQHYLADLIPGALFGWLAYIISLWLLA